MESFIFMCLCAVWGEALRRGGQWLCQAARKTASVPRPRERSILRAVFGRAPAAGAWASRMTARGRRGRLPGEIRGRK